MVQPLSVSNPQHYPHSLSALPLVTPTKLFFCSSPGTFYSSWGFFAFTDRQHQKNETMCIPTEDGGTYHGFETPWSLPYSALPLILARYTDTLNQSPSDYRESSLSRSPSVLGTLCVHPNGRYSYTSKYKFQVYYHALASTVQSHRSASVRYKPDSTTHEPYQL